MTTSCEEFERWWKLDNDVTDNLKKFELASEGEPDGRFYYDDEDVDDAWDCWQAATVVGRLAGLQFAEEWLASVTLNENGDKVHLIIKDEIAKLEQ